MTWPAEIRTTICERLAAGESLRAICRDEGMPDATSVFRWLEEDAEFATKYARAREVQAELLADEMVEIADDSTNDFMERKRRKGDEEVTETAFDAEHVQRSKLRIETRRWIAEKLLPKKYGAKQQVEHSGSIDLGERLERAIATDKESQ